MTKLFQSSIVSLHKPNGLIVGTGFLASSRYILTCGHVVNDALNLNEYEIPPKNSTVKITFQLRENRNSYEAKLIHFIPPLKNPTYGKAEDIALLELNSMGIPAHDLHSIPLIIEEQIFDKDFRVYGFPTDKGEWLKGSYLGVNAYNWIELDIDRHNVIGGFSGAPIWDNEKNGVSGLMVAGAKNQKAYMISMKSILSTFKELKEARRIENTDIFFREIFQGWVWKSNIESVDKLKFSILAFVETLIVVGISLSIWKYYDYFYHIIFGMIIAHLFFFKN